MKLHRVNLLEEMIGQVKDETLLKHHLRYTYIGEKGDDVDGVLREVYAAFRTEQMDHTAEGEDRRVPSLCPKWQEEEWKSIVRIFPVAFPLLLQLHTFFDANEVSDDVESLPILCKSVRKEI